MSAISSTVSGTQATSRRNHSYCCRPTGRAGGSVSSCAASRAPNCSKAALACAAAELSSAAAAGSIRAIWVRACVQAAMRSAMPSSSATASSANSRAWLSQRLRRVRQGRGDGAQQPHHLGDPGHWVGVEPGRSRTSKTGPSAWSIQNRGMHRTRRMSLSHSTRAIADHSSRWSTRSATCSGRIRPSSAWNTASSSRRRSASAGSTSGRHPAGRSRRGMSSRVRGCWRARQAQNRSASSSSSCMDRACRGRERLRNHGAQADVSVLRRALTVTHSYRS